MIHSPTPGTIGRRADFEEKMSTINKAAEIPAERHFAILQRTGSSSQFSYTPFTSELDFENALRVAVAESGSDNVAGITVGAKAKFSVSVE